MKKCALIFLIIKLLLFSINSLAFLNVTAESAILMDAQTGEILYKKNIHQPRPPASTTKIMTGILAIELGNRNDNVVVSRRAANEGGSSLYLEEGEELTLEDLIYGLLVKSGNDSAVTIAEHIAGSVEDFARLMNIKALEAGALNTNFKNPNGLPQEGHLSTAYDLAQITRYALNNQFFSQVVATEEKRIPWEGNSWDRVLRNTNRLLKNNDYVDGVKTGYTIRAGRCLVTSATKNGQRLISVVLKSGSMWHDSLNLLDYGFANYSKRELVEKDQLIHNLYLDGKYEIGLKAAKNFHFIMPNSKTINIERKIELRDNIKLPIISGEKMGSLSFYKDDKLLGRVDLVSDRELSKPAFFQLMNKVVATIQIYF